MLFSAKISSVTCRRHQPQRKTWKFAIWLSFALLPFNVHVIASFQSCCRFFPRFCIQLLLLALSTSLNIIFFRNYIHEMYKYEKIRPIVVADAPGSEEDGTCPIGSHAKSRFIYLFSYLRLLISVCTKAELIVSRSKASLNFHYLFAKSNCWRWNRLYLDWTWLLY